MPTFVLQGTATFVVLLGVCASLARCDDGGASVHTVIVTDCSRYFIFQTMGAAYSHWKSRQPGAITRVMCCSEADRKNVTKEELALVKTHIAPDFSIHPETGDVYGAYNKPGAVLDFLQNTHIEEEFVFVVDGDMLLRHPVVPQEMGARLGLSVSARYGYLKGVSNELALKHIPYISPRLDTEGGVYGRRADQVGGFFLTHQDDMRRVAPLWLKFTADVRQDPDAWNLTGDIYSTIPGSKPWISEMYGYAFGAATAGLWHKIDESAMIYPEYVPNAAIPKIIHYGLLYNIPGTNFSFDKHWDYQFDPFLCPPWDLSKKDSSGGLFPHPPHPRELTEASERKRYAHLISIETANTLNEAFCEHHLRTCPPSPELLKECGKVHDIAVELEEEFIALEKALCVDQETPKRCQDWNQGGECRKNPSFMKLNCSKTCGYCFVSSPRRIFEMKVPGPPIEATGNSEEHSNFHAPDAGERKEAPRQSETMNAQEGIAPGAKKVDIEAVRELKRKCGSQGEALSPLEMEKCLYAAKAGLKYQKHEVLPQNSGRVLRGKKSQEERLKGGPKAPTGAADRIAEKKEEDGFSKGSVWIVQLWMWGLVIFGCLSLMRARRRMNKARYTRREEGLVGLI